MNDPTKIEIGMPLYLYTARNGKFNVYEGMVTENKRRYWTQRIVTFKKRASTELAPKEDEIGHVLTKGPRLWLAERDDALARRLFLKYEKKKLEELKKQIDKKRELIAVLKEGLK